MGVLPPRESTPIDGGETVVTESTGIEDSPERTIGGMIRRTGRVAVVFAAIGACVGAIANAVWAWAAADERRCYTYINLAFFNQAGSYTDGTCYDPDRVPRERTPGSSAHLCC